MSKNKKNKDLQKKVEEMVSEMPELVEFDVWYVMRRDKMPKQHMKEVIKADFMGRGLDNKDTLENYDKALEKYGIKLG